MNAAGLRPSTKKAPGASCVPLVNVKVIPAVKVRVPRFSVWSPVFFNSRKLHFISADRAECGRMIHDFGDGEFG